MKRSVRILVFATLALCAAGAQAAITCTITSSGWSMNYVPTNPVPVFVQSSYTLTCSRAVAADSTSLSYFVGVDNGQHFTGTANRALQSTGTSLIAYENYKDSACTQIWKSSGGNRISGSMTFSGFLPTSVTTNFYGCITTTQTGLPADTYRDVVTMTATTSGGGSLGAGATSSFNVAIYQPAICNITKAPGDVAFTYTAFRATAATASTTFGVTCTNGLPYNMALDATSGVVSGLQYTVSLSAPSGAGTGSQQNYTVNGSMAAGQAGTCTTPTCSGTDVRTLTISY